MVYGESRINSVVFGEKSEIIIIYYAYIQVQIHNYLPNEMVNKSLNMKLHSYDNVGRKIYTMNKKYRSRT